MYLKINVTLSTFSQFRNHLVHLSGMFSTISWNNNSLFPK